MEKRKTIQVNPDFFKLSKKTKNKKKKKTRMNLRHSIKPNNLKKQLLARIKNHQQQQKNKNNHESKQKLDEFQSNFNSSLNYLQKMIKQKKEKKSKKTRKKKNKSPPPTTTINTRPFSNENFVTPQLVKPSATNNSYVPLPAPPYGCLKNGLKPTYSQYMKTIKKKKKLKPALKLPPKPPLSASVLERKEKLNKLKETLALPKKEKILKTINKKKTIKIFKLGKKEGKVGVLVKSAKTRKKVREEQKILHSKCILEVKRYLRKHNLIKAGTTAPENILRKLYEDSFLAGDIYNKNPDILLHNFIEKGN